MAEIEIKPFKEHAPINTFRTPFSINANTYNSISYEDFFNNHMRKNMPCIIRKIGVDWDSTKKWAKDNKIEFDYLSNQYGNFIVPVSDCKNVSFDCQSKSEMKFSDYIAYWKNSTTRDKLLYLKDWHLRRCKPDDRFYTVPTLFGSDWLNEYAQDKRMDDFMFVYMGPTSTWTPIHADVYNSFSWSVNVTGKKRWILFPPGEEEKLKDKSKNVVVHFEPKKFKDKKVTYHEIIQEEGDAIFVPSGWYHQVENLRDTISINHNWVNGTNILNVWKALTKTLVSVQKEIEDLKDVDEFPCLCQNMLKNLHGMDFSEFTKLIAHIGRKRVAQLEGGSNIAFNNQPLGKNHCMFDLKCINDVVKLMTKHSTFVKKEYPIHESFVVLRDCLSYILLEN